MLWYMPQNSGWIKLMLLPVCCVTRYRKFIQAIALYYQQLKTKFLWDTIFKIIQTHTKCCFSYLQSQPRVILPRIEQQSLFTMKIFK